MVEWCSRNTELERKDKMFKCIRAVSINIIELMWKWNIYDTVVMQFPVEQRRTSKGCICFIWTITQSELQFNSMAITWRDVMDIISILLAMILRSCNVIWKSMQDIINNPKCIKTAFTVIEYNVVFVDIILYCEILWNIMKYHEISCNIMKYYGILWNIMQNHEISDNIMEYHEILWNIMEYYEIYWSIMKYEC